MYSFRHTYRVSYADTDQMGYMYYGHYARMYEIGRVEALRNLGVRYRDMESEGIIMPVYDMNSQFILPAKYDELLTIEVRISQLPSVRVFFEYNIFNEEGQLLQKGSTTLVFVQKETSKIVRCPQNIVNALAPYFEK